MNKFTPSDVTCQYQRKTVTLLHVHVPIQKLNTSQSCILLHVPLMTPYASYEYAKQLVSVSQGQGLIPGHRSYMGSSSAPEQGLLGS